VRETTEGGRRRRWCRGTYRSGCAVMLPTIDSPRSGFLAFSSFRLFLLSLTFYRFFLKALPFDFLPFLSL
jgi:hypothetical protein